MNEELWTKLKRGIEQRIGADDFRVWFGSLDQPEWNGSVLSLYVPNQYSLDKLTDKFYPQVKEALQAEMGIQAKVEIMIRARAAETIIPPVRVVTASPEVEPAAATLPGSALFPRYTFDNFVNGESNQLAYAAALAVANTQGDPPRGYNPLFIYGGTGLGKTHLMHAIGHARLARNPSAKVVYVTSETFLNEFIECVQQKRMGDFQARYRSVDVLLIDDIQFLSGKIQTLEEFFHTFNSLYDLRKQLVFTADKPIKELVGFEERVLSRFQWGLSADIQPPNLETRIAILKKRADEMNVRDMPDEIINFIAHNIKTHIRDLEGALNKVVTYAQFTRQDLTIPTVKELLKDIIGDKWQTRVITVSTIQKEVADHFHLNVADLKSKKKAGSVSFPRQIAMFIAREMTDLSLQEIGAEFGGRDHSTVLHAFHKISDELEKDQNTSRIVATIKERL
ncbi:MAG TPA: chromosomal replication initiator protein DnaA [bacterium]|nr:chromosomal replication initiator protein DnaA [bacterium]